MSTNHPLYSSQRINERISELAQEISTKYQCARPLFICLLRGGAPFATKLMFALAETNPDFQPELDYMTVRTYGNDLTGKPPELIMDLSPSTIVTDRSVIILDDVLDQGHTATFVTDHVIARGARSADLVVLIQKLVVRSSYKEASLYGFEAPAEWLIGMGMDDPRVAKEAHRWSNDISIASE